MTSASSFPPTYRPAPTTPQLGDAMFDVVEPARFPRHVLRFRNQPGAVRLGLGELSDADWINHFGRFTALPENLLQPLALRYHGHQFQSYNARLGDGRGFLFAQLRDDTGRLLDLSTKGSGQTPWSRGGDGKLTLKGGIREVLATEMLEALRVHTSKSVSLIETGEQLTRNDEPSPTRASVLVRLMESSIRYGTFQRVAHEADRPLLSRLVEFTIGNYFLSLSPATPEALFAVAVRRAAELVAGWTCAGFVHGVLNTDNMNITGESFDYGPWRFLPHHDPAFVAAYFDHSGLYAFGRQGAAVRWNLERLADALGIIADKRKLEAALIGYEALVLRLTTQKFLQRLNRAPTNPIDDAIWVQRILCFLHEHRTVGWDRFFFDWEGASARAQRSPHRVEYASQRFLPLRRLFDERALAHEERAQSPYLDRDGPVTMHIDEVERVWSAIADRDDWSAFEQKIADVRSLSAHLAT